MVGRGGMLSLRLEVVRMNESQKALCKQPRELIGNLLATEGANRYYLSGVHRTRSVAWVGPTLSVVLADDRSKRAGKVGRCPACVGASHPVDSGVAWCCITCYSLQGEVESSIVSLDQCSRKLCLHCLVRQERRITTLRHIIV